MYRDPFGFADVLKEKDPPDDDLPIRPFSAEWMMDTLARKKIGGRISPTHKFVDQVTWGEGVGAVRARLTPNLSILIERRIADLEGNGTWILKRVFKPKIREYAGKEEFVAADVFSVVEPLYFDAPDAPKETYEVRSLVKRLTLRTKNANPDLLVFHDVKLVKENYYSVYFNLRGVGVGKLTSRAGSVAQTPEATVDIKFDKSRGLLHVILTTVSVTSKGADWELDIPYLDAFFAPSQRKDEITDTVLTTLKYF